MYICRAKQNYLEIIPRLLTFRYTALASSGTFLQIGFVLQPTKTKAIFVYSWDIWRNQPLNTLQMQNKTNPAYRAAAKIHEDLVVAFQEFNGVYLARISNLKDKETHAFGATKKRAEENAMRNFQTKYANFSH